jgi:hypothetical protein
VIVEQSHRNSAYGPGAFLSSLAAFVIGVLSFWLTSRPAGAVSIALALVAGYTAVAAHVGLSQRSLAAGLTVGALALTLVLVLFDWALGLPESAPLRLDSFIQYLKLYRQPAAVLGLAAPILVAFAGFAVGVGLHRLASRGRSTIRWR